MKRGGEYDDQKVRKHIEAAKGINHVHSEDAWVEY